MKSFEDISSNVSIFAGRNTTKTLVKLPQLDRSNDDVVRSPARTWLLINVCEISSSRPSKEIGNHKQQTYLYWDDPLKVQVIEPQKSSL